MQKDDIMKLGELANKYGTDKKESQHNYIKMYEEMLNIFPVTSLLEIGLGMGSSLKMWREYLPNARLYCVEEFGDENKIKWGGAKGSDIDRLIIYPGSSDAENTWVPVPDNLDVIIDDGSHEPVIQIKSFALGFPHLRSGGLYFIEDTHSSIQPVFYKDRHCLLYDFTFDLILKQQEARDLSGNGGNFYLSIKNMDPVAREIFSYHFYKSVIIFQKA
jgi:hypothetical protein